MELFLKSAVTGYQISDVNKKCSGVIFLRILDLTSFFHSRVLWIVFYKKVRDTITAFLWVMNFAAEHSLLDVYIIWKLIMHHYSCYVWLVYNKTTGKNVLACLIRFFQTLTNNSSLNVKREYYYSVLNWLKKNVALSV